MTIKVGLNVTCQAPLEETLEDYMEGEIRLVHAVRDAGWDSVWASHHYMPKHMRMPHPGPWMARLAVEAGELAIGVGILLLGLLNPLDVAETYGTVDVMSRGRLILGVGLGYRAEEFEAFGMSIKHRVHRFTANLEALTQLWSASADAPARIDLEWCHLETTAIGARPHQTPRPPIWIGANRDPAIRRAARLGDAWLIAPFSKRDTVLRQIELYKAECAAANRELPAELPLGREIYCASTHDAAVDAARRYLGGKYTAYADWRGSTSRAHSDQFEDFARDRFVIGTPEECIEALVPYLNAGVTYLKFRTRWLGMSEEAALDSVRLLANEVVPALRDQDREHRLRKQLKSEVPAAGAAATDT